MSGTLQPDTICNVEYNGSNSPLAGMIDNPASQQYFLMIDGPLSCRQTFLPSLNQSVVIRLSKIEGMSKDSNCITQCGDNGCHCVSQDPLKYIDHVMIMGDGNLTIACLCGAYQEEFLPVSIRTWSPITLIYSSSNHTWNTKRFGIAALYSFKTDFLCGMRMYTLHAGEYIIHIDFISILTTGNLHTYVNFKIIMTNIFVCNFRATMKQNLL